MLGLTLDSFNPSSLFTETRGEIATVKAKLLCRFKKNKRARKIWRHHSVINEVNLLLVCQCQ